MGYKKDGRKIQNSKLVLTVYLLLRAMVVIVLVDELLDWNFEHVYICILTLLLFMLPSVIERRFRIDLPDVLEIVILVFIFAAEILGEIQAYYLRIPSWDTILHTLNGFLFAAIGFSLINILNEDKRISLSLSPLYMAITAFCFSMTIGVLWEFFEWAMDMYFRFDMQKDTVLTDISSVMLNPEGLNSTRALSGILDTVVVLSDGTQQRLGLGGYLDPGLHDTMMDLLVNFIGAVVFSFFGYFYVKSKGEGKIARMFIPEIIVSEEDHSQTDKGTGK